MSRMVYAQRLACRNIQVFEIQPGVMPAQTNDCEGEEKVYEDRIAGAPLTGPDGRNPGISLRWFAAIADGYLDYCAGQIIHADGGFHLRSF